MGMPEVEEETKEEKKDEKKLGDVPDIDMSTLDKLKEKFGSFFNGDAKDGDAEKILEELGKAAQEKKEKESAEKEAEEEKTEEPEEPAEEDKTEEEPEKTEEESE